MSIAPYQGANQAVQNRNEKLVRKGISAIKTGASLAAGMGAAQLTAKITPFLSDLISPDIFFKGLSKINPHLANFIKKAQDNGYGYEDIKEFLKEKVSPQEDKEFQKNPFMFLEGYDPNLVNFVQNNLKQRKSVREIGSLAKNSKEFAKVIKRIEQDTKEPIEDLLERLFTYRSEGKQASPREEALRSFNEKLKSKAGLREQESERVNQAYSQQPDMRSQEANQMLAQSIAQLKDILSRGI